MMTVVIRPSDDAEFIEKMEQLGITGEMTEAEEHRAFQLLSEYEEQ